MAAHRGAVSDEDLKRIARDIEATLVDSGKKSTAWSDIVTLALRRLETIDPVSARRLAANYTDETGAVRFDRSAPERAYATGRSRSGWASCSGSCAGSSSRRAAGSG